MFVRNPYAPSLPPRLLLNGAPNYHDLILTSGRGKCRSLVTRSFISLIIASFSPIFFALLRSYRSPLVQYVSQSVAGLGMSLMAAPLFAWMDSAFSRGKLTCIGLAYNAAQVVGGVSPAVVTVIAEGGGNVGWWVAGCAIIGAVGVVAAGDEGDGDDVGGGKGKYGKMGEDGEGVEMGRLRERGGFKEGSSDKSNKRANIV